MGPGGGADQLARLVSKLAEPLLGQGLPVVNVPGGTGGTGMAKLLSAPADGYSAAIYIADSHALLAGKKSALDHEGHHPGRGDDQGAVVHLRQGGQPVQDLGRFREGAARRTRQAEGGDARFRQRRRFLAERHRQEGTQFVQVPFSKPSERYVSILGGHADALYEQAGDVAQFLNNKQMRPLMIFGKERLPAFKDVPSSYELGFNVALPQFRSIVVRGHAARHREEIIGYPRQGGGDARIQEVLQDQYGAADSFVDQSKATKFIDEQLDDMKKTMAAN